jgi:hypothetical protein
MKTTNVEGGMRDPEEAVSIMQKAIDASKLCSCWWR